MNKIFLILCFCLLLFSSKAQTFNLQLTEFSNLKVFSLSIDDIHYAYSQGDNSVIVRKYGRPNIKVIESIDSIITLSNCTIFKVRDLANGLYIGINKYEVEQLEKVVPNSSRVVLKTNEKIFNTYEIYDTVYNRVFNTCLATKSLVYSLIDSIPPPSDTSGYNQSVAIEDDSIKITDGQGILSSFLNTVFKSRNALSITNTGNSGVSTYNSSTGVFNIPNYTLSGLGGIDGTLVSNQWVFGLDSNTLTTNNRLLNSTNSLDFGVPFKPAGYTTTGFPTGETRMLAYDNTLNILKLHNGTSWQNLVTGTASNNQVLYWNNGLTGSGLLTWDATNFIFSLGRASNNLVSIEKFRDTNNDVMRLTSSGATGGYGGGFLFRGGNNNSAATVNTFTIYTNSTTLPGSVYVGDVTMGNAQSANSSNNFGIKNKILNANITAFDAGINMHLGASANFGSGGYDKASAKTFGIFIGGNATANMGSMNNTGTYGVFAGYQYQPTVNGWGSSWVFFAKPETGSGATEVLRLQGKDGFVGLGITDAKYKLDVSNSTNAIAVPSGTTTQRPTIVSSTYPVRFNSDSLAYEGGYGVGDWRIFVDRDYLRLQLSSIPATWLKTELESGNSVNINATAQTQVTLDSSQILVAERGDTSFLYRRGTSPLASDNLIDVSGVDPDGFQTRIQFADYGYNYFEAWGLSGRNYYIAHNGTRSSPSDVGIEQAIHTFLFSNNSYSTARAAISVFRDTTASGLETGSINFYAADGDKLTPLLITSNYLQLSVSGGGVGIGVVRPVRRFHLNGTFRLEGLGSSSSTTELLGRNANKDVFPISIGPGLSLTSGVLSATKAYFYVTAADTIPAGNTLKAIKNLTGVKLQGWHVQADSILVCDVAGDYEINTTPYLSRESPSNGTIEFRIDKNDSGIASSTCYQSTEMIDIKAPCPVTFIQTFSVNDQLKFKSTAQGTEDTYITINCTSHKVN